MTLTEVKNVTVASFKTDNNDIYGEYANDWTNSLDLTDPFKPLAWATLLENKFEVWNDRKLQAALKRYADMDSYDKDHPYRTLLKKARTWAIFIAGGVALIAIPILMFNASLSLLPHTYLLAKAAISLATGWTVCGILGSTHYYFFMTKEKLLCTLVQQKTFHLAQAKAAHRAVS